MKFWCVQKGILSFFVVGLTDGVGTEFFALQLAEHSLGIGCDCHMNSPK